MESVGVLEQPLGPGSTVLRCISEAHPRMLAVVDHSFGDYESESDVGPVVSLTGRVGRPRFEVPRRNFCCKWVFQSPE